MGCFTTCFNNCKPSRRRGRRRRSLKTHPSSLLHHLENYQSVDDFKVPELIKQEIEEIEEREGKGGEIDAFEEQEGKGEGEGEGEGEEKGDNAIDVSPDTKSDEKSGRKKVRFDLNVKFYENLTINEEEIEEIYEEAGTDDEDEEEDEDYEEEEEYKQGKANSSSPSSRFECECECASDSSPSSLFSYPVNNRYQNIRDSDDEFDDVVSSEESDTDDDYTDDDEIGNDIDINDTADGGGENDGVKNEEQSSESLFSLSIDSRKKILGAFGSLKEVNSPIPPKNVDSGLNLMPVNNLPSNDSIARYDRVQIVDSVLNPVENLTQWKGMKSRSRLVSKNQPKDENFNSAAQDFSFPVKKETIEVDTSLSTWLMGGAEEGTPKRSNSSVSVGNSHSDKVSPNKFEDRPILGALTLEEIRQISAGNTPRKCRSKSPDEKPIIGSVGSYWSHTGQATDSGGSTKSTKSRYRESAEIIWDATPFETRLEKALEKEANAEQVITV